MTISEMKNKTASLEEIKVRELIEIIKTRFMTREGLLARNYPVTGRTLFDNFDDIAPFFIYFNETDFLLDQIHIIRKNKESLWSLCNENGVLVTRNIDEWFGGLYALWKESGDRPVFELLEDSLQFVLKNMVRNDFLSAAYYLKTRRCVPYYESWSAGLLETFCEMGSDFPSAFENAERILHCWIQADYFKKYSLFPYRTYINDYRNRIQEYFLSSFPPLLSYSRPPPLLSHNPKKAFKTIAKQAIFQWTNGYYSQLMKSNSTCAFALLEFYNQTGNEVWLEALTAWIEAALHCFADNGKTYMEYVPKTGLKRKPSITPAFILVDIICDALFFAQDELLAKQNDWLAKAKSIVDFQWENRIENGLIPYEDEGRYAHLDSQVDFAVTLRRYAEISGTPAYREKALELMNRSIKYHYSPEGYFTYSGDVPFKVIDPKYNALFLKGLINMMTINESMYPRYYALFKDR